MVKLSALMRESTAAWNAVRSTSPYVKHFQQSLELLIATVGGAYNDGGRRRRCWAQTLTQTQMGAVTSGISGI